MGRPGSRPSTRDWNVVNTERKQCIYSIVINGLFRGSTRHYNGYFYHEALSR